MLVLRQELSQLKLEVAKLSAVNCDFPSLPSKNSGEHPVFQLPGKAVPAVSSASVVRKAVNSGALQNQRPRKKL